MKKHNLYTILAVGGFTLMLSSFSYVLFRTGGYERELERKDRIALGLTGLGLLTYFTGITKLNNLEDKL